MALPEPEDAVGDKKQVYLTGRSPASQQSGKERARRHGHR